MKKLTLIEMTLSVLFFATVAVEFRIADWFRSMPQNDPVRQLWQARMDSVGDTVWLITFVPWIVFTGVYLLLASFYLSAWAFQKLGSEVAK